MLKLAESHILSINPYVPGRVERPEILLPYAELASNENILGPSPLAVEAVRKASGQIHLYPSGNRQKLIKRICDHLKDHKIRPSQIALGNGSSELIVNLVRGVVASNEAVMSGWPTFIMYRQATITHNRVEMAVANKADLSFDLEGMLKKINDEKKNPVKILFLPNPNNPTGQYINESLLTDFIKELPKDLVLVLDEAYFEYVIEKDYPNGLDFIYKKPRIIVLRTFSKIYGLAGLRVGYAVGDETIIDILCRVRDPFNVNCLGQVAAEAALGDKDHIKRSVENNIKYKAELFAILQDAGLSPVAGVGNFLLAKRKPKMPEVNKLCQVLLNNGVAIRGMAGFGLPDYVRITVGGFNEQAQLKKHLAQALLDG